MIFYLTVILLPVCVCQQDGKAAQVQQPVPSAMLECALGCLQQCWHLNIPGTLMSFSD